MKSDSEVVFSFSLCPSLSLFFVNLNLKEYIKERNSNFGYFLHNNCLTQNKQYFEENLYLRTLI
jgi:hypothetical protein